MEEIQNCRRLRKIIMYTMGPKLCEDCKKLEEEEFQKVRKFVREYPGATIQEVSAATEVPQNTIHKYLKDGRLEVAENSPIAIQCEKCGARIRSGRFCAQCSASLARDMMNAGVHWSRTRIVPLRVRQVTRIVAGCATSTVTKNETSL
jgi:flagellar operon protein (TIGR03826 family)